MSLITRSLITRNSLILASALGGGVSPGPAPGPSIGWPYQIAYQNLLSVDDGKLNQHEDKTGGWVATNSGDAYHKSSLSDSGWTFQSYYGTDIARLTANYRINFDTLKVLQIYLNTAMSQTVAGKLRVEISDDNGLTWTVAGTGVVATRGVTFDVSAVTGYKLTRFVFSNGATTSTYIAPKIACVPNGLVYAYGECYPEGSTLFEHPQYPIHSGFSVKNDRILITCTTTKGPTYENGGPTLSTPIDLTDYTSVKVTLESDNYNYTGGGVRLVPVDPTKQTIVCAGTPNSSGVQVCTFDIASLTGEYFVQFIASQSVKYNGTVQIFQVEFV